MQGNPNYTGLTVPNMGNPHKVGNMLTTVSNAMTVNPHKVGKVHDPELLTRKREVMQFA